MAMLVPQTTSRWVLAILGVIAIVFGLVVLVWPHLTLAILIIMFGIFALAGGVTGIVGSIVSAARHHPRWWIHLIQGVISLVIGILLFTYPGMTLLFLLYFVGLWALLTGILQLATGIQAGSGLLGASGIISIIFGLIFLMAPFAGLAAAVLVLGFWALIYGVILVGEAIIGPRRQPASPPSP